MSDKLLKSLFSFLFFCVVQHTYCMEKTFKKLKNKLNNSSLHNSFSKAVELAYENGFSSPDCETIKELITKGANPNWGIEDKGPVLNFAITHQKKDLFNFLLENNANINARGKDMETPLHSFITSYAFYEKLDINIEDLLKHGADTNARTKRGFTPLCLMFSGKNIANTNCINYIKYLVKYGAEINNEKSGTQIPLAFAVSQPSPIEVIQTLCKLGASLILDENENIFHFIIARALFHRNTNSIKYIEPIITHARFDDFGKGSKKTVLCTLLAFQRLEETNEIKRLPKDVKLRILSNLPLSDLYQHKKLCVELLQKNYHHILLPQVHERVQNIKQILVSSNKDNQTALQYALEGFDNNQKYINNIQPLLDETLVQKNYDDFIERFPTIVNSQKEEDKKNLARQMFDNCAELFLE